MTTIYRDLKEIKDIINSETYYSTTDENRKEKEALQALIKDMPNKEEKELTAAQQHKVNMGVINYFLTRLQSNNPLTDVERHVLGTIVASPGDVNTNVGKKELTVQLFNLKGRELRDNAKVLPEELQHGQRVHQLQSALDKYENDPTEKAFFVAIDNLYNEINKSLEKSKQNLPANWKNYFPFFKTKSEKAAESRVNAAQSSLAELDKIRESMANRINAKKESESPHTIRIVKGLLKSYQTNDNREMLKPLQDTIDQDRKAVKEEQLSWKNNVEHDNKGAIQAAGMMHHTNENEDNTADDLNRNSPAPPNPTHNGNNK